MGNQQNYQALVEKVNMYLDNELSQEAERELLKELKQNPCIMKFLVKNSLSESLSKVAFSAEKVSPSLIQSIKEKIRISPV